VHELSKRYFNIYTNAKEEAKNWLKSKKKKSDSEANYLDHLLSTFGNGSIYGSTVAVESHFAKRNESYRKLFLIFILEKDVEFGIEDFVPSSDGHCPSYYRGVLGKTDCRIIH
jgi:hypothetical protein